MKTLFLSIGQALLTVLLWSVFSLMIVGVVMVIGYLNTGHYSTVRTLSFIGALAFAGLVALYYRVNRTS